MQPSSNSASFYNEVVNQEASLSPSMTGSNAGVEYSAIVSVHETDTRDNAMATSPVYRMDGTLRITRLGLTQSCTWDQSGGAVHPAGAFWQ